MAARVINKNNIDGRPSCCLVMVLLLLLNTTIIMEKCHGEELMMKKEEHDEKEHNNNDNKKKKNKVALFVFGDSLYDPGNNKYLRSRENLPTIHKPYGQTYFNHPTGRFSDGRIVPDFIASFAEMAILSPYLQPNPSPFTEGANFASGGAGVTTGLNQSIKLPMQLGYLKEVVKSLKEQVGEERAKCVMEDAVYLFSAGGNDYIAFQNQNPNTNYSSKLAFVSQVVSNLTTLFKEVYNLGGRKFGYQNVGPLGCTPMKRLVSNGDCDPNLMELARLHNQAFSIAINKLEIELFGFKYSLFDYYHALYDRINNPFKYGLKEGKVACCGVGPFRRKGCGVAENFEVCNNPNEYLWFDSAHPVEQVNFQIAKLFWNGPPNVTSPYNLMHFFGYY